MWPPLIKNNGFAHLVLNRAMSFMLIYLHVPMHAESCTGTSSCATIRIDVELLKITILNTTGNQFNIAVQILQIINLNMDIIINKGLFNASIYLSRKWLHLSHTKGHFV